MDSASLDQPEMMWDEEAYLEKPFPMNYDEWLSFDNAPIPEHEEIYYGGEEVWVLFTNAMDLVECGEATGNYKWHGYGFYTGVMVDGGEKFMELCNVWACVNEDVE